MPCGSVRFPTAFWPVLCLGLISRPAEAAIPASEPPVSLTELPAIEVTGTRIRHADTRTSSPVEIIHREDIESSGKSTLSDVVRSLTIDGNGTIGLGNVSGFAMGSSGVSLRGLAVNATLVLINGRRTANYGLADDGQRTFVNLSAIPLDVVERIEVLKDGGSAVYGSDAIAGVVNIILRERFDGVGATAAYGVTEYHDGANPRASLTLGHGKLETEGYNAYFNVEASHRGAMYAAQRSQRAWIGNGDLRPYGYGFTAGGSGPNLGGWFDNASGAIDPNGYGAVSPTGLAQPAWQQLPGCPSGIRLPSGYGGCAWDRVASSGQILPSEDKINLYVRGSLRVTDGFNPYVEFGRFQSRVASNWVLGPTSANESWVDPATNSVVNNANLILPASNPDNPLHAPALLGYEFANLGSRAFAHDSVVYRSLLGTRGRLESWDVDAGLLYATDTTVRTITGFVRNSAFQAALGGASPYGYYRLGANGGLDSPALLAFLSPSLSTDNRTSLTLVDFKATRAWSDLPGGPLSTSIGAEYRRDTLDAPPMPDTANGDLIGWSYYAYRGEEQVVSVYAEAEAPVARALDLDAALRLDKSLDFSPALTPKAGFVWRVCEPLAIRGTFSMGYRTPNAVEKGPGNQNAGSLDMTGNGFLGVFRNLSNPHLEPERSRMVTFGPLLDRAEAARVGLNFWWLERSNEINLPDPFAIPAGAPGWPNAVVVRNAQGEVLEVAAPYENNSTSRLSGIDLTADGRLAPGGMGHFDARFNWSYLASYRKTFIGQVTYQYAGTHGPMVISGNTGTPRNRGSASFAWGRDALGLSATANYVDGFDNVDHGGTACASQFANGNPAPPGCRIASFTSLDLRATYRPAPGMELNLSVTNAFDRIAPLDPSGYINLNFDPAMHLDGAIGRTYGVGVILRK